MTPETKAQPIDLTVRPLPPVGASPEAVPAREAQQPPAMRPQERSRPETLPPVTTPSWVQGRPRSAGGRLPVLVVLGVVAVLALGGGIWWFSRSSAPAPAPAPGVADAPISPASVEAAPLTPANAPLEATSATPNGVAAAVTPAPVTARVRTPPVPSTASTPTPSNAATRPARTATQAANSAPPNSVPSAATTPAPIVVVVPSTPAGPPPTAARSTSTDPDAPVVTRPQPLE